MKKSTQRQNLPTVARMFGALSDETRLGLCLALQAGERNVNTLCARLKLPQPRVSHHLALLRLHGLVQGRRQGKEVYYSVNAAGLRSGNFICSRKRWAS